MNTAKTRTRPTYTMFHGTSHVILGSGLTIAGATFCLHFTRLPYFQSLGIPMAIGMVVIVAGRAHPGTGGHHRRQSLRRPGSQAQDADPGLAPDRHRGGAMARAHPHRDHRAVADRTADPARLHRPTTTNATICRTTSRPTSDTPPRNGISRSRPVEPGIADDRKRPRPAQSGRLPGDRQDRQEHLPSARHLAGPGHHPAAGNTDRAHLDPVPDQHAGRDPAR